MGSIGSPARKIVLSPILILMMFLSFLRTLLFLKLFREKRVKSDSRKTVSTSLKYHVGRTPGEMKHSKKYSIKFKVESNLVQVGRKIPVKKKRKYWKRQLPKRKNTNYASLTRNQWT